jgi:hypothetical protein
LAIGLPAEFAAVVHEYFGTPVSTTAARTFKIQASRTGSITDAEKERLRVAFGKGPVAPNLDVEVSIG